jgi:glycosyltransferase involved in cell wall biosynthesis
MKVVLATRAVHPYHPYGGMEKYVNFLGKYLKQKGVDVEIYTSLSKENLKTSEIDGVKYNFLWPSINWHRYKAPWTMPFVMNLGRKLKKKEFDVLHSFEFMAYSYLHQTKRKPVLVQPFAFEPFRDQRTLDMMEKSIVNKLYMEYLVRKPAMYCLRNAEMVALEGEFQNHIVKEMGLAPEKTSVIPVGIDIQLIRENINAKGITRKELGLGENDFIFLSVNRLDASKGYDYMIKAFALAKKELPDAKMVIVGGGPEEEKLKALISELGIKDSVIMVKNVPEDTIYAYYNNADAYVSPTLQDDFMMSILEGMSCGLPVVSTGQDFLVKEGVNGYVVPKRNPEAMAKRMIDVSKEGVKQKMGGESIKVAEYYDFRNIADMAIKTYDRMV